MGSMITLGIDKFEIDWGKNSFFRDHSELFIPSDLTDIPYYYADDYVESKQGYSRNLSTVSKRLDLLGYSVSQLEEIYNDLLNDMPGYYGEHVLPYKQFSILIKSIDLAQIDVDKERGDYDFGEFVSKYIFQEPAIKKLLPDTITVDRYLGQFLENVDPYLILRLLAENNANSSKLVQWRFADVVNGGWTEEEDVIRELSPEQKILIVTEGSSDSFILQSAIEKLRPEISDFFYFVDMEEHYPFTGTGNLYKFCQGLASIGILNKVLVILDNDTAGNEIYEKCIKLNKPSNIHFSKLPYLEEFSSFKTVGPTGVANEDINGKAVAIECFLDLSKRPEPSVRWTSFNKSLEKYQGELEYKESYTKDFKNYFFKDSDYDTRKLIYLIDYIIEQWIVNRN